MHTFTALFDKRADAEAMQAQLDQLGIVDLDHGVHDRETAGFDPTAYSSDENKGLWGSHKGAVPPDQDRHFYEEALRRGGFLLTVNVDDAAAGQVYELLNASDAVDFDDRERELKRSGFAAPLASAPTPAMDAEAIQIVEERLSVGKRQVDRGGVRVRAYTVETPVHDQVQLRQEHVELDRRPVNQPVGDAEALFQERRFEATEIAEEVVVGKEARVIEEIVLRKEVGQRVETVRDTVRHTEVEVERLDDRDPETDPSAH